jgi:putative ABC transport system substrate-binding protein
MLQQRIRFQPYQNAHLNRYDASEPGEENMRRREFIAGIGGTIAWPLMASAQSKRKRRVGVLIARSNTDPQGQKQAAAFEQGLRELGWSPSHNIHIDYRWQTDDPTQRLDYARQIVSLSPDILVANSTPFLVAVRRATNSIPIVFVGIADPVEQGFVESLARPGGIVTGFGVEEPVMGAKWAELLKEIAPEIHHITAIFNPDTAPYGHMFIPSIQAVFPNRQHALKVSTVRNEHEIQQAIAAAALRPASGLIFFPDSFLTSRREFVVGIVAKYRIPATYAISPFAKSGGLIAYGIDRVDVFHRAASYVDRILRGDRPADLPVQMPTKFELVINLKTAKALGLTVPPSMLARADEVIE